MAGSISGKVIDVRNNQPVSGAAVSVSGPKSESTKSAEDGTFKLADLPAANNYTMDVSATGYTREHYEDIVVLDDVDTDLGMLALWPEE